MSTRHRSLVAALATMLLPPPSPWSSPAPGAPASTRRRPTPTPAPRDVIVHLFEWPWASIATECTNVLGPKGFGAVQVSPPQEHVVLPGQGYPWWQDYQPVSYQLVSRARRPGRLRDHGADLPHRRREDLRRRRRQPHGRRRVHRHRQRRLAPTSHYSYPAVPYGNDDFHHCGRNGNDDIAQLERPVGGAELRAGRPVRPDDRVGLRARQAHRLPQRPDLARRGRLPGRRGQAHAGRRPAGHLRPAQRRRRTSSPRSSRAAGEPSPSEYAGIGDVTEFRYGDVVGNAFRDGNLSGLNNLAGSMLLASGDAVDVHRQPRHPAQRPGPADLQGRPDPRAGPGVQPRLPVRHAAADEQLHLHQHRGRPAGRRQRHHQRGHLRLRLGVRAPRARSWPTWSASTTPVNGTGVTNWRSQRRRNQIAFGRGNVGLRRVQPRPAPR